MRTKPMPSNLRISGRVAAVVGASLLVGGLVAGCGSSGGSDATADGSAVDVVSGGSAADSAGAGTGGGGAAPAGSGKASSTPAAPPESLRDRNHRLLTEAMAGKSAVACDFTESGAPGKVYLHGEERFRFEGMTEEGPMQMVREGAALFMWAPGTSDGLSMNVSAEQVGGSFFDPADLEGDGTVEDLNCNTYTGKPDIFDVPADVQFVSIDEMLKGAMDPAALEEMLNSLGAGGN